MSAQTPGRGVSGLEPREGHPGPAQTCGAVLAIQGLMRCTEHADAGHRCTRAPHDQRVDHRCSCMVVFRLRSDDDWAQTLFEQRDQALATIERVRALLRTRAQTCPGAEFVAIADIKAALTGGLERRVTP